MNRPDITPSNDAGLVPESPALDTQKAPAEHVKLQAVAREASAAWLELMKAINAAGHNPTPGNFLALGFKAAYFAGLYDDVVRAAGVEVE